jgi:two-component system, chemotaxis family, response regulator Rcp1
MSATETVGRPMEILLVEDSLVSARITMGALRKGNVQHRMTWLADGNEALEFIYRRGLFALAPQPDLILLDLGLPGRDGREILTEIKADPELQKIPIVVLTASTSPEDYEASEQLNVEGYLTKPVDLDKFLILIKELKEYWHAGVILPVV